MSALLLSVLIATTLAAQGGVIGGGVQGLPNPPQPRDPRAGMVGGKGVIRGRVTAADTGVPMRRANVMLFGKGQRGTQTDAEGRYQFEELPAGAYTIGASPSPHRAGYQMTGMLYTGGNPGSGRSLTLGDGQILENVDLSLPRGGVIAGRVLDPFGEPAARVNVAALRLQPGGEATPSGPTATTDDLGNFRLFGITPGTYLIRADLRAGMFWAGPQDSESEAVGFMTTYAPGTYSRSEATQIRVTAGAELNTDVRLLETRLFRITGTVLMANGESPKGVDVSLVHNEPGSSSSFGASMGGDGRFTFRNVPPGTYEIHARLQGAVGRPIDGPALSSIREMGIVPVDVTTTDVESVVVALRPGQTVRGEIVFDGAVPQDFRANLSVQSGSRRHYFPMSAVVVDGGAFTARDLFGPVLFRGSLSSPGATWTLKSVLLDGRDITDVPTTFSSSTNGRLQVVFTSNAPALEGIVTDEGKPATADTQVALFSAEEAAWVPFSTRLRTTNIGPEGKFSMRGLREGRYYAIATPGGTLMLQSPERAFLESLKKVATEVVLNPGETRALDLRVIRFEQ